MIKLYTAVSANMLVRGSSWSGDRLASDRLMQPLQPQPVARCLSRSIYAAPIALILVMQAHASAAAPNLKGTHIIVVINSPENESMVDQTEPFLEDGGKRKRDEDQRLSRDVNFWQFDFDVELPKGRKQLKFTIEIDGRIQPYRNHDSPQLLAKDQATALTRHSTAFIPAVSGTYRFDMPRDAVFLSTFAFMTTESRNYDIVVEELRVDVWPQRSSSGHLGEYRNNQEVHQHDSRQQP